MKAFRVGPFQIYCQPNRVFTTQETLAVVFQLNDLSAELAAGGEIRIEFLKDGQPFRDIRRKPSDYPDLPDRPRGGLPGRLPAGPLHGPRLGREGRHGDRFGHRGVRPELRRGRSPALVLVAGPARGRGPRLRGDHRLPALQPRPVRRGPRVPGRRLSSGSPDSEETAANLARVYLALEDAPPAVVKTLAPFVDPAKKRRSTRRCVLAAEALKRTGEFGRAIELLDKAVAHYGVNAVLLNSTGECYAGLGKTKEALMAFEKSLELSPDQPGRQEKGRDAEEEKPALGLAGLRRPLGKRFLPRVDDTHLPQHRLDLGFGDLRLDLGRDVAADEEPPVELVDERGDADIDLGRGLGPRRRSRGSSRMVTSRTSGNLPIFFANAARSRFFRLRT